MTTKATPKTWIEIADEQATEEERQAKRSRQYAGEAFLDVAKAAADEAERALMPGWAPLGESWTVHHAERAAREIEKALRHEAAARTIRALLALATGAQIA